jgi:F0F1-type ATP synthase membrane subunit b/b'
MPQLDFITMFSQLFWLFVIFFIFYIIVSKNLLPAISQVKKVRLKRLKQGNNQLSDLIDEQKQIISVYEESVLRSLSESRSFLNTTVSKGDIWVRTTIVDLNKESLQKTNSEYLKVLGTLAGKRHLLKNLI